MKTAVLLAALALPLVGCSGEITGQMYFSTKGGEVRRLADHHVIVLSATPEVTRAMEESAKEGGEAGRAADALVAKAQEEYDQAHREYLATTGGSSIDFAALAKKDRTSSELEKVKTDAERIKREHSEYAVKIFKWATVADARTDVNGVFHVGVRPGRFYLVANHSNSINSLSWMVPVDVGYFAGTVRQDLTGSNAR